MVKYYAVHVISGREGPARESIINRAIASKMWQYSVFDVLVPTQKEYVTKNGMRKVIDKKIFSGYVFVKAELDSDTEKLIVGSDCVSNFMKSGGKVIPLTNDEVANLLKSQENIDQQAPKSNFKTNDNILIVSGPFSDLTGTVFDIDDQKGQLRAYIQIFGRSTLTELDIQDVQLFV